MYHMCSQKYMNAHARTCTQLLHHDCLANLSALIHCYTLLNVCLSPVRVRVLSHTQYVDMIWLAGDVTRLNADDCEVVHFVLVIVCLCVRESLEGLGRGGGGGGGKGERVEVDVCGCL